MLDKTNNTLKGFETLILVKVKGKDNIYHSNFDYQSGSFARFNVNNFNNFEEMINSIYKNASICEGIGYYEYCNQIRKAIAFCFKDGRKASFILPLKKNDSESAQYFLMNINKVDNEVYALFISFDERSEFYNIEDFSFGTFKDSLTGLFNYHTLVNHISDNKRRGYLCLYDLNNFKMVNDYYGHETGDDVLVLVSDYLKSIASMNEVFYRRSGDEFVILVFEHDMEYVLNLINKIEQYIESIPIVLNKDFHVSAAFGILELITPNEEIPFDFETQFKLIDLAMYQAKHTEELYHYISHKDALKIVNSGELEERIESISKLLER